MTIESEERVRKELEELRSLNEQQYQFALRVVEENESLRKEQDNLNKQIKDMAANIDRAQIMVSELEIENRVLREAADDLYNEAQAMDEGVDYYKVESQWVRALGKALGYKVV